MAVSDNFGYRENSWQRLFGQVSRYDLVLAVIPQVFAVALMAHLLVGVSLHLAMGTGALCATGLVVDVLYLHPPTDRTQQTSPEYGD